MKRLNSLLLVLVLGTAGFLLAGVARADDDDDDDDGRKTEFETVECDDGDTIAEALRESNPKKPLVIEIIGVCNENVSVNRSNTTLRGTDPENSKILGVSETDPVISISGVTNVSVENLTVSDGGSIGILINRGGGASIFASLVRQNGGVGIQLDEGANARIGDITLGDSGTNTITGNAGDGIIVNRSSTARIENNTVEDNGGSGVGIFNGSSAELVRNAIQNNIRDEVLVTDGSTARLTNNEVTDNSSSTVAVGVFRSSNLRLLGDNTLVQQNEASFAVALSAFHLAQVRQSGSDTDEMTAGTGNGRAVDLGNFATVDLRGNFTLNGNVRVLEFGTFRVRGNAGRIDGDVIANDLFTTARESGGSITLNGFCTGDNCSIVSDLL